MAIKKLKLNGSKIVTILNVLDKFGEQLDAKSTRHYIRFTDLIEKHTKPLSDKIDSIVEKEKKGIEKLQEKHYALLEDLNELKEAIAEDKNNRKPDEEEASDIQTKKDKVKELKEQVVALASIINIAQNRINTAANREIENFKKNFKPVEVEPNPEDLNTVLKMVKANPVHFFCNMMNENGKMVKGPLDRKKYSEFFSALEGDEEKTK